MATKAHERSGELFERAEAVIPGGIYGHQSPRLLTRGAFPSFLAEASGCRVRDVDGNTYIDYLCAYGPIVLGYNHPAVEAAAARQRARGDTLTLPAEVMVDLAERLVALTPGAAWCVFAKNGSDVCTWSLAVARAATGRKVVAMADHAYHGVHGWCNHMKTGFLEDDRCAVRSFEWNDIGSLERIFAEERDDVAAVIVTPFRHELLEDSVLPAPGFLEAIRQLCTRYGAAMIVDDVRAGFRLNLGGSTQTWGVTPDLLVYSKAVANGYPLSVMLGRDSLRAAAESVFMTGTFFLQAVPLAAALATVDELEAEDGIGRMGRAGQRLCNGLGERAAAQGFDVVISGPPAIPFMTFRADEGSFKRSYAFAGACARRGVLLHPLHNWFLSVAHADVDIDATLDAADESFREMKRQF
jgi:glutamate-1-semialdehyde 2,1-aminomutase